MSVLPEDLKEYTDFTLTQVKALKSFEFQRDKMLWHYTTGPGLLGIIESGTIFATQVACLSDSTEIRYGTSLFKRALTDILPKYSVEPLIEAFLRRYLATIEEEPDRPNHAPSPYFVICFSEQEDDLSQWRSYGAGENGYAVGFPAAGLFGIPNSIVACVNYDGVVHLRVAAEVAEATVRFFRAGLEKNRAPTAEQWEIEFGPAWENVISHLAPLVKDPGFAAEKEYRMVHELVIGEMPQMKFVQKGTMMSRHLPLRLPSDTRTPSLPIGKVMVGPCRHREITRISVDTLLRQMGYGTGLVLSSKRPFQQL